MTTYAKALRFNIVKSVLHAFGVRAERGVSGTYSSRSGDTNCEESEGYFRQQQ